jgi:hypothetical protein
MKETVTRCALGVAYAAPPVKLIRDCEVVAHEFSRELQTDPVLFLKSLWALSLVVKELWIAFILLVLLMAILANGFFKHRRERSSKGA